eukprot:PhM_4_TR12431/c0_g1_i1/m.30359
MSIALDCSVNVYGDGGKKVYRGIVPLVHRFPQAANLNTANVMCLLRDDEVRVIATRQIVEGETLRVCHLELETAEVPVGDDGNNAVPPPPPPQCLASEEGRGIWMLCHGRGADDHSGS